MLNVLDLFSGIGGFSLGLERTGGFKTVAFCEIDPYCRAVLRKHWPDVPCYDDVRTFAGVPCDVICGGFPCQDISVAGDGVGIDGERSGLWREFARLIGELRPRYAIVENVSALTFRGLLRVLGDLAEIGFNAEWHCIPASAIGAPHRRDRIWLIAYPDIQGPQGSLQRAGATEETAQSVTRCGEKMADSKSPRFETCYVGQRQIEFGRRNCGATQWAIEPDVGRVAHGVPAYVDRLACLGNAVVPQIVEIIGRAILEAEQGEVV